MTPGKAEWIEVIGFKGCIIIWRIQRTCLCLLPTHSVPVWRQRAERKGKEWGEEGLELFTPLSVLVSPIGLCVLPKASGLHIYLIYWTKKKAPEHGCRQCGRHPSSSLIKMTPSLTSLWLLVFVETLTKKRYFWQFRNGQICRLLFGPFVIILRGLLLTLILLALHFWGTQIFSVYHIPLLCFMNST